MPGPILCIEGDPHHRAAVRHALEKAGHAVLEAGDGLHGMEVALRDRPALILLDVSLPDADGSTVARVLRTHPALAATPIVCLTAGPLNGERVSVAGCDGYIDTPIDVARFADEVGGLLGRPPQLATPTSVETLNGRFVSRLVAGIDEAEKTRRRMQRRAAQLERIDAAVDGLTAEIGTRTLLDLLLPRLADALGAVTLTVELGESPSERIVGRSRAFPVGETVVTAPPIERRQPLGLPGRPLGVVYALYARAAADDEMLLRVAAHQLALSLENAVVYARERSRRRELEDRDRRKDEFLAVLAHELRAPLAAIVAAMALIAEPATDPAVTRTARAVVTRQVRHQAGLLDDLLDLARVAHGQLGLRSLAVDLRSVTAAAIEMTRPAIEERGQVFTPPSAGDPLMITGDPVRLEQVVINLLTNATKNTPTGGAIAVLLDRSGDDAVITVRDSGEGIPAELLDRVFDPFVQASQGGAWPRPEGLGIGLALARRLVEFHGGTIVARSAGRGHGAEFVAQLPLAAAQERAPVVVEAAAPEVKPAHILIVEDDADTREMLRLTLQLEGHRVDAAGTGREAVELAARTRPEVMIIDLGLPDIQGHEVARRVRARFGDDIYLIALTGYGRAEDVREAEAAGFDAHVLKPATSDELAQALARRGPKADAE
jgi:signal transduction histidine kinase/ActR/RegA family two-component response regulator